MTQSTATISVENDHSEHLRHVAIQAALCVQDDLKAAFRSSMALDYKVDRHDVVTVHDKAAEEKISNFLISNVPDSEIVGEEGGKIGQGAVRWYVDPIDGTANFACGLPNWCISIGAVIEDEIVAGAIVDPMGGNIFSADLNGAYLNGKSMRSSAVSDDDYATIIASYPSARDLVLDGKDAALDRFASLVETYSAVRRSGSAALGIAQVAAGWADGAAGFGINPWDVTAGILILRQAGGQYQPFFHGDPASSKPDHFAPAYVALGEGADCTVLSQVAKEIVQGRIAQ